MPRARAERSAEASPGLVFGRHPVLEALQARRRSLDRLLVRAGAHGRELDEIRAAAGEVQLPVEELAPEVFDRRVPDGANAQGVLLRVGPLPEPFLEELFPESGACTLVALDGVEDPQNLGAIARVAEAAGAAGLIVTRRRSPPLGGAASSASAGALEWLPVARVPNLARALKLLKEKGFWVYGADSEGGAELFGLPPRAIDARRIVVLGAEGRGLREGILSAVDHRVRIPLYGRVASLNVATAAAVVLFELARRAADLPEA